MYVCYKPREFLPGLILGLTIVLLTIIIWSSCGNKNEDGYLDYMPSAIEPCPSHYRCGAESINQVKLEKDLYLNLQESNKYANVEQIGSDECCVRAGEAEPMSSMLLRSSNVSEKPMGEGMYTPHSEIEARMMSRRVR